MPLNLTIDSLTYDCHADMLGHQIVPKMINDFMSALEHTLQLQVSIPCDSPTDAMGKMAVIESAIGDGQPLSQIGFDDGSGSEAHAVFAAQTLYGIIPRNFQWVRTPGHLAWDIAYSVTVSWAVGGFERQLLQYSEVINIQGQDGAVTALAPGAGVDSTYETIASQIPQIVVTQQGTIKQRSSYPLVPDPVITTAGALQVGATNVSRRVEQQRQAILAYVLSYSYTFILPTHPGVVVPSFLT